MHMFDNLGNVAKCLALNVFEKCLNFVWRFLYKTCTHFYWQWPRLVFSSGYSPRGSFFSLLRNNTEILVLGQNLYTRIWVCAMIGLFKKPVSICQTGWREIWNSFPVMKLTPWGPRTRISALFKERGKESTSCRSSYRPLSSHQSVWQEHRRITGKILQKRQKEA